MPVKAPEKKPQITGPFYLIPVTLKVPGLTKKEEGSSPPGC